MGGSKPGLHGTADGEPSLGRQVGAYHPPDTRSRRGAVSPDVHPLYTHRAGYASPVSLDRPALIATAVGCAENHPPQADVSEPDFLPGPLAHLLLLVVVVLFHAAQVVDGARSRSPGVGLPKASGEPQRRGHR